MNHEKSPGRNSFREINSIFDLAYGNPQEYERLSKEEIRNDLKVMGVDTEKGWQAMQTMLRSADGKIRLAKAREERLKTRETGSIPGNIGESVQELIEQIKGLLMLGDGKASVFARKAESMPISDLKSLRDQLVRTAARAAKKPKDES